jgi:glutathione synthase
MHISLGVVMDPIATINVKKDSTFAMLLEAQTRGWSLQYMEQRELFVCDGCAWGQMHRLQVMDNARQWYSLDVGTDTPLNELDVILMRKDPPFNMEYIYSTYILELASLEGVLVVNDPISLRNINEKFYTTHFPRCCPPATVTRSKSRLKTFLATVDDIVVKPLDAMGGESIFRIRRNDPNTNVILETITRHETRTVMAQQFIPEYISGDKRILLIDGNPVPYALARIPAEGEARANLAVGGEGKGVELMERDRWICQQVGPILSQNGILFAGLDVIGNYLTEINITSPTCIRELDSIYNLTISRQIMDVIAERVEKLTSRD